MNTYVVAHSGVKGMRWGIMNGPPYPLSRKSDGSLNRQKQDSRKRYAIGNASESFVQQLKDEAKKGMDEHTLKLINSVKDARAKKAEKAEQAKKKFDERSRENLTETIKQEMASAKAARQERREQKEREKTAAKEAQKRLAEEKARAAAEDEKEALRQYIRHNPTSIYKYADAFTDQEMNDLIQRIDLDRKIKDVRDQELYRYKKYLETGVSTLTTLATGAKQATQLYDSCAQVWNSVGEYSQNKAKAEGKDTDKKPFTPLPVINKGGDNKNGNQQFKQKDKQQDNQGGQQKENTKSVKDIGGFVDDDAAEKKAREKKDKQKNKQEKSNVDSSNTIGTVPSQTKHQDEAAKKIKATPLPKDKDPKSMKSSLTMSQVQTALNKSSIKEVNNFWEVFNKVKDEKINDKKWNAKDEINFAVVMDVLEDNYLYDKKNDEWVLRHSGLSDEELEEYLEHHGILGMKWGVRRFQNEDGSLTPAGRERYHRMIAENVVKDQMRQNKAAGSKSGGLGYKLANRNRNKVLKEVQKEFYETPEGERLKRANAKLAKISKRTANRDASLEDQSLLGKGVNRLGQTVDKGRAVKALAEQNEAQKAGAKVYEEIREKYADEILDATIKDLKIWEIDDGREFLDKYLKGNADATFGPRDKKQERLEAKEVKEARKAARLEEQQKTFKELYGDDYDQGPDVDETRRPYGAISNDDANKVIELSKSDVSGINLSEVTTDWINEAMGNLWSGYDSKASEKPEYIEKVKDGDNTRYFYDKEELNSYLEKDGYQKNKYDAYVKTVKSPNKNISEADIDADRDSYFKEPLSNEDYKALLKDIEKNYNTIQKNLGKAMVDKLAENDEYKTWASYDGKRSAEEQKEIFLKNLGTQIFTDDEGKHLPGYSYIRVMGDGYGEFAIDCGGEYGDHWLTTEVDWTKGWKKPKVTHVSIEG